MGIKLLVFHGKQGLDEKFRQLLLGKDDPVLMLTGMKTTDAGRIQSGNG